jgi:tetratricopeptide (TPR) repeat protein
MISQIGVYFTEIIADQLFSSVVDKYIGAKFHEKQLKSKIKKAISVSLDIAIQSYPGSEYIFENFDTAGYLSRSKVIIQIQKLINEWESPDINILFDEWVNHSGLQNHTNLQLILTCFIQELSSRLRAISEIRDIATERNTRETRSLVGEIHEFITDLKRENTSGSLLISASDKSDPQLNGVEARIETLVKLYRDGNPNASLRQLKEIEAQAKELNISNKLFARVLSTIGGCLFALDNEKDAIEYITRAYQIDGNNPDTIANYSLSTFIKGDKTVALELAEQSLSIKPEQNLARIVRFTILSDDKDSSFIDQLIDQNYLNDAAYCRVIGLTYQTVGNEINCEKYLRMSISLANKDIHSSIALASLLVETEMPNLFIGSAPVFGGENRLRLHEALQLVETAVTEAEVRDNPQLLHHALASRAGIRAILGDYQGAIQDCENVLSSDPVHPLALHNRALLSLSKNETDQAISYFEKIPQEYLLSHGLILPFIVAYIESNNFDKASQLLSDFFPEINNDEYYDFIGLKAWILIKHNFPDEAFKIRNHLVENNQNKYRSFEAAGNISKLLKDFQKATEYLITSHCMANYEKDKQRIALNIAEVYLDNHDYNNSINWFETLPFTILSIDNISHRFVSALFYSRNYGKLYEFLRKCYECNLRNPELLKLQSWIAEYLGDLHEALNLLTELTRIAPNNVNYAVELARLLFKTDNKTDAIQLLDKVKYSLKDPWDLIQSAELYSLNGNYEDSLALGYLARRNGIDIPEIHMAYLNLFHHAEDKIDLKVDIVKVNSAVLLSNSTEKRWLKIVDIDNPVGADWEFGQVSFQAEKLLGHKVGDSVILRSGSIESLSFSIIEIQSIFVRAYQETFEEFSTRFPQNMSLQRVQVVDNDFTNFFNFIARSASLDDEIINLYSSGGISLEQFAQFLGKDQVSVFLSMQHDEKFRIFATIGNTEDQALQKNTLSKTNSITLSLTGIFTLKYLNLLDLLTQRFLNIYISQRLIDTIIKVLLDLDIEKVNGRKTIGFSDGKFYITEIPSEVTLETIKTIEEIQVYIKNNCKVIPISPENADFLSPPEIPHISLGEVNISLIPIAKQTNTPIYADDYNFRTRALDEYNIFGFWTQELLLDCLNRNIIDSDNYTNACTMLALANYYYLSISSDLVYRTLRKDSYQLTKNVDALLKVLKGPDTIENNAILLAGSLLKHIWLEPVFEEQRILVLDRILDYLTTNRIRDQIIRKLLRILKQYLLLAPLQFQNITNAIFSWSRLHPPEVPILMGRRGE